MARRARPSNRESQFSRLDGDGRLWFTVTASAEAWHRRSAEVESDGYIAVIDDWRPGIRSTARVVATDLGGTNELRFSSDGTWAYVAETGADHLTRFRVRSGGTLTDREIYGPGKLGGGPDGFAFDVYGNLWTTLIVKNRLVAITPNGDVLTLWRDEPTPEGGPRLAPSMASVTFGGDDLRTVYIGSLGGTSLPTFRSPVPGAPLSHWH